MNTHTHARLCIHKGFPRYGSLHYMKSISLTTFGIISNLEKI